MLYTRNLPKLKLYNFLSKRRHIVFTRETRLIKVRLNALYFSL